MLKLHGINLHPVKSGAVRPVRSIAVRPGGLRGDRTWMVVDGDGRLVSAREAHGLLHVVADTPDTDPAVRSALRLRTLARHRRIEGKTCFAMHLVPNGSGTIAVGDDVEVS